ncbi:MAG: hypothetical protein FJ031_15405, partial [Chloroflexi bacterium]|nr:hypothetical protein [Chloroflexota bacterium]
MTKKPRVALVVGSGSVKCAALGLWKALDRAGIPIDMLVGCSGGSLYTSTMALGFSLDECIHYTKTLWNEKVTVEKNWRALLSVVFPKLFKFGHEFGMVSDRLMLKNLRQVFGEKTFADAKIPLTIMTTDFYTGEQVPLSSGSIVDAIRASIAIPFIWGAHQVGDRVLIDGAASNPMPVVVKKTYWWVFALVTFLAALAGFYYFNNPTLFAPLPNSTATPEATAQETTSTPPRTPTDEPASPTQTSAPLEPLTAQTELSTEIVTLPAPLSATPKPFIFTPSIPVAPTVKYPDGYPFSLVYNESSFYLLNRSIVRSSLSGFAFQRLDADGLPVQDFFQGFLWEKPNNKNLLPKYCVKAIFGWLIAVAEEGFMG